MIWLVLFVLLTVLLVVLNNIEIVSDEFAGWCFPVTAMVSIIFGVCVLVTFVGNVNMQQNKESERGEIVRLLDERYAPDYSEVIKRAFEFNQERKIDSTFNQKWWTVGFRDQYVIDSIPIPLLIGTRRSELDVNLK